MTDQPPRDGFLRDLVVILIGTAIIGSLAFAYALGVKSSMPAPGVEIELDALPVPGGDWDAYRIERLPPPALPVDSTPRRVQ